MSFKNSFTKLCKHINNLISNNSSNNIPLSSNILDDYFTYIVKQANAFDKDKTHA